MDHLDWDKFYEGWWKWKFKVDLIRGAIGVAILAPPFFLLKWLGWV